MLEGYRSTPLDLLALPIFSFFYAAMIGFLVRKLRTNGLAALNGIPLSYYLPVAGFSLFLLIAIDGWMLFWVIQRYGAI